VVDLDAEQGVPAASRAVAVAGWRFENIGVGERLPLVERSRSPAGSTKDGFRK